MMSRLPTQTDSRPARWVFEPEVAFLILFVALAHFIRAGELPLRGEESTRGQMAFEMVQRNDYLVPRAQGEPFWIRPPFQMWAIAASCLALGDWSEWTIRLHSLLATLGTTLLVYGYARSFMGRVGALAAGLAFASSADWFQMGRQAETEALFTLLLGGALLLWHWGMERGWPGWACFSIGYSLMAMATLTKGLQAPVYFVGATWLHMIFNRDWKRLFSAGHLAGLLAGAIVLAAWVVPYAGAVGWGGVLQVWTGDPAYHVNGRIANWKAAEVGRHLLTLPAEIVAGGLPWSPLLLTVVFRDFRSSWGPRLGRIGYLWTCIAVALPSIWIPPGGLPRYFAPLMPCVAVLAGAGVEWIAAESQAPGARRLQVVFALLIAGLGLLMGLSPWLGAFPRFEAFVEPVSVALPWALVMISLAVATAISSRQGGTRAMRVAVCAMAMAMAIHFSVFVMDFRVRRSEKPALAMQRIKEALPQGQKLVSLGTYYLAPLFAYHYGLPITTRVPWPVKVGDLSPEVEYFCFEAHGPDIKPLPFAWKEIGSFPLERYKREVPYSRVIVGRREKPG